MRGLIWLQTATVFWLGGGTISQLLNIHGVNDVRQTEIHTAEPTVPEPSASEVELVTEKIESNKSPGIDQIPAELFKAGGKTIRCEIHKLIISLWNEGELSEVARCHTLAYGNFEKKKEIQILNTF
jgi:hypothetical protein